MDEETPMESEKNNDAEDQPPVLKEEAIALAEPAPPVVDVAKKRRNTNIGVGIGVLLQVGGLFIAQFGMNDKDAAAIILGLVLILVSILLLIWGCMNYGEAKGYSKKVGLIGLLGIIGLIVLIVLPDKIRDGPEARMSTRKIWGLVLMALGLGLFMVGYVLEEAAYERDRYSNRVFEVSLIVLGLILLVVSLVMLLYNRKRTQPKETHPEDAHEGET